MPELPEVETIKNILIEHLIGKNIHSLEILREKTIDGNANEFKHKVEGKTIVNITRRGKFLVFHLSSGIVFLSHLRMEGKYYYYQSQNNTSRYQRVRFNFSDGSLLIYDDSRQFGIMILKTENDYLITPPISSLGPEPFNITDISNLVYIFKKKSLPIKSVILDQNIISGLGNIYADEVLFLSKLHPETPAKLLTKEQIQDIVNNSVIVLNKAIKAGGSTIKTYHPANGVDGNFQSELNVYDHPGKPCPRCGTPLVKIFVGQRGSTYCPHCQKNPALPYTLGLTGPIASGKDEVLSYFANHGYKTLNSDNIVKYLYTKDDVKQKVCSILKIKLDDNGNLDYNQMRDVISVDIKLKQRLEKYIHPLVKDEIIKSIKQCRSDDKIIIEVPLLFESHMEYLFDDIVFIDVDIKHQIEHLKQRHSDIEKSLLLNTSFAYEKDKRLSKYIVDNNATIEDLHNNLDKLLIKLRH